MWRSLRAARWPWLLPLAALLALYARFLTAAWPLLGHDFEWWFRALAAGRWHVAHHGLWPMRYAVHLCGGLPMYGHPNDIFYSPAQLLALAADPWIASVAAILLFLAAGYAGWYRLSRDVFRLERHWSHALALMVAAHGFHVSHAVVGHMNFMAAPMLGWMAWLLLSADTKRLTPLRRDALFALTAAVVLHAAGYFVLLFFALLAALLLPLACVLRREWAVAPPAALAGRCVTLAVAAGLACLSKLSAVASLMATFPRSVEASALSPGASAPLAALTALFALPQRREAFAGVPWSLHENSHFLSPAVLAGALVGVVLLVRSARGPARKRSAFIAAYALSLALACILLIRGNGPLVEWLRAVPPLQSMRVMMRLLYPFSLPLVIGAVFALRAVSGRFGARAAAAAMAVTLAALPAAYGSWSGFDVRHTPAKALEQFHVAERAGYERLPVTRIMAGDTDFLGASGQACSGDALMLSVGRQIIPDLHPGPVSDVRDGAFNLINPACYAYPEENGCAPGDRIAASDAANLAAFTSGGATTWKVSAWQRAADAITLAMLSAGAAFVAWGWRGVRFRP